jgi:prepilin-type processing-associated H-X9-DG protein
MITRIRTTSRHSTGAFTLVELLVVIGIIAVLVGLLMPALIGARKRANSVKCASNLRQIALTLNIYADRNKGWVPRDTTIGAIDHPPWPLLVAALISAKKDDVSESDLPGIGVLQCPAHPLDDLPSGYVVNAFRFDTSPNWSPDGPEKLVKFRPAAEIIWFLDCADFFPAPPADKIFDVQFHDVWDPRHLPDGVRHRISDNRHGNTANVLYVDGHVSVIHHGELTLEMLDDHLKEHATP